MIGKSLGSIVSDKQIQELIAVQASAMVSEAVSKMSEKGVGAILIKNSQNTVDGIFTERDLMIRVVNAGRDAKTTAIGTVMSSQVRRVEGWTSIEDALGTLASVPRTEVRPPEWNVVRRTHRMRRRRCLHRGLVQVRSGLRAHADPLPRHRSLYRRRLRRQDRKM